MPRDCTRKAPVVRKRMIGQSGRKSYCPGRQWIMAGYSNSVMYSGKKLFLYESAETYGTLYADVGLFLFRMERWDNDW